MPPSIRLLPADQGDLVVPYVLAVPAETKPVVSIPCELMVWEMQTPQSHRLVAGCHQSAHRLTTISLFALQEERGKGLGAGTLVLPSSLTPHWTSAIGS